MRAGLARAGGAMSESWLLKAQPLPAADVEADPVDRAYRQYWSELCRYVRRAFGAGPPEPEEVAQGAFVRFAALDRPSDVANPRAFLYQCARNIVHDYRRREGVRVRLANDPAVYDFDDAGAVADGERVLSAKERLAIVEATVRSMEARRRKVLIMHAIHGLNYTEIARRLKISPTRVTQLFAEAVAQCDAAVRTREGADG